MNDLIPFDYSSKTVKVVMDENGDPWWVAKDVCEVLDLKNHPRKAEFMGNNGRREYECNWRPELIRKRLLEAYSKLD